MQNRSNLYNRMMQSDLRDITTASIYIGAVNQKAQSDNSVKGSFWKYADIKAPLDPDSKVENIYFSWEEKLNKLDGSMCFSPETDTEVIYNQGIVSSEICTDMTKPEVHIQFGVPQLDIKGLTIDFGESFPEEFSIETNSEKRTYHSNTRYFVTEDVFEKTDYMKIIPVTMSHGFTRLRIERLMFGIGIGLTGNKIISMSIKEKTHPISLELPTVDFSFKVDNQDRYFNANADDSVINFLERGQEVKAYFDQMLEDGAVESINAANTVLDATWKDKGTTAEFTATDILYQMDGVYDEGIYRKEGISAYDLLLDVFQKSGLTEDKYSIDPYLHDVTFYNPMPKDTFANCILLIANACRCVMRPGRDGKIVIKASFRPELAVSTESEAEYSNAELLLEEQVAVDYFEWQQKYNRLDGSLYWKPEGEKYHYSGYVSSQMSDEAGLFETNPMVAITASAAFNFYQLTIEFGNVFPKKILVHCYNNEIETESFYVEVAFRKQIINHAFINVDMIRIEFVEAEPHNRIHIHNLSVDESTDFTIFRDDLLKQPVTERQDKVKDITVIRTVYSRKSVQDVIFTDSFIISPENTDFKLEFNSASIPVSIVTTIPSEDENNLEGVVVDYGAEIVHYSNWYCKIHFSNPPEEPVNINLKIEGYTYDIYNPQYVLSVNTTGTNPEALKNPLIDSLEMAEKYAEWCGAYFQAKAEYTLSKIMGNPILESNDLAFFEDEDGSVRLIRVHTINLKFDGTYNGSSCSGRSI